MTRRTAINNPHRFAAPGHRLAMGLALACATALALPGGTRAQDLLEVWRAAASHDARLSVARAEHGASATLRDQASALARPQVGLNLGAGVGASESAMRGARFSAPALGTEPIDQARFATSVAPGLATRAAVVARQPLIDASRDARQAQLQLGADMGDTAWRAAQSQLMLATAERYFALALADEHVRVTARQVEAIARMRTEAHDRYALGAAPITDTYEADAALAAVQAREAAARLDASVRRQQLADSTGLPRPTARLPLRPLTPPETLASWQVEADAGNPRLHLLVQAVAVSEQKLREHAAADRATVDLVAEARHDRIAGRGDFGHARNRELSGMVGVQIHLPLYSGGMLGAREREAAARLGQARAELDLAREEVDQQVRTAWLGLQAGAARIAALDQSAKASAARLDATRLGLEVGDRTLLDLLDAENGHAAADLALAEARSEQALTRLRLAALADRLDEALLAEVDATLAPAVDGQP